MAFEEPGSWRSLLVLDPKATMGLFVVGFSVVLTDSGVLILPMPDGTLGVGGSHGRIRRGGARPVDRPGEEAAALTTICRRTERYSESPSLIGGTHHRHDAATRR